MSNTFNKFLAITASSANVAMCLREALSAHGKCSQELKTYMSENGGRMSYVCHSLVLQGDDERAREKALAYFRHMHEVMATSTVEALTTSSDLSRAVGSLLSTISQPAEEAPDAAQAFLRGNELHRSVMHDSAIKATVEAVCASAELSEGLFKTFSETQSSHNPA